jgi:hypothetical protein
MVERFTVMTKASGLYLPWWLVQKGPRTQSKSVRGKCVMKNFSRKNKKSQPPSSGQFVPAWVPGTEGSHDPIQKCARTMRDEKFFTQKQKNLTHP